MNTTSKKKQIPGQLYTFKKRSTGEEDTGVLPTVEGESNSFAYWIRSRRKSPGCWASLKFRKRSISDYVEGRGKMGLLGRMKNLLRGSEWVSAHRGYNPPQTTPEQMVKEWEAQDGKCAACHGTLKLFGTVKSHDGACYDHCHKTGKPRGFIHRWCNTAEGAINRMSSDEFLIFSRWIQSIKENDHEYEQ
jgi:hypothetical protein